MKKSKQREKNPFPRPPRGGNNSDRPVGSTPRQKKTGAPQRKTKRGFNQDILFLGGKKQKKRQKEVSFTMSRSIKVVKSYNRVFEKTKITKDNGKKAGGKNWVGGFKLGGFFCSQNGLGWGLFFWGGGFFFFSPIAGSE